MNLKSDNIIPEQRRAVILEHVQRQGSISVPEVASLLSASVSTVRRDLDELASRGVIVRTHGGAMLAISQQTTFEPDYHSASQVFAAQKKSIGRTAANLIQQRQSVLFDSSSTVFQAANFVIERRLPIVALTNDLNIAKIMADTPHIQLKVTGGSLRPGSYTLMGSPGQEFIDTIHVDVCLLGVHAITLSARKGKPDNSNLDNSCGTLSDTSLDIVAMKRRMVHAARKIIVLADSSKFGLSAFCDVCALEKIDTIVTDQNIQSDQKDLLENNGVEVVIAD